jgi:hypothetical protein
MFACQPQESNLPCRSHGFTDRSLAVSGQAGLGWPEGLEPSLTGFTGRLLGRFGFGHRAQRRNRTSVPRVWTGRSAIELAELERAQEESNPYLEIPSLVPWSFRRWTLGTRSTSRTCLSRLSS